MSGACDSMPVSGTSAAATGSSGVGGLSGGRIAYDGMLRDSLVSSEAHDVMPTTVHTRGRERRHGFILSEPHTLAYGGTSRWVRWNISLRFCPT